MQNDTNEFDFSRNDKFYTLSIPRYSIYDDTVLYQFHLKDLVNNKQYVHFFRFKDLKEIHQSLNVLKLELPQFPKTHFWRKTNKNPQMIQQRRVKLQYYFQIIVNDPFTRGYSQIKKFIKKTKNSSYRTHRFSSPPSKSAFTSTTRSRSFSKISSQKIDIYQLKRQNLKLKSNENQQQKSRVTQTKPRNLSQIALTKQNEV